ncbi:hypothetical protein K710_1976 [Streptococcus iniae SF1]|nr:hypothetical protein K710_1976 [Streptococcus iniae SF1]
MAIATLMENPPGSPTEKPIKSDDLNLAYDLTRPDNWVK